MLKRGRIIILTVVILPLFSVAQNLVPNPSFESMTNCSSIDLMTHPIEGYLDDWFSFDYQQNTVDVFHSCIPVPQLQPPNTLRGISYPNSGEGMIGMGFIQELDYREVASAKLVDTLEKDSAYCVSFWVKNSRIQNMYYWAKPIGVLFTVDTVTLAQIQLLNPHVSSEQLILDNNEWVEISGYFIANGGEKYINLGFFGPNITKYQSHEYVQGQDYSPYYFFDDVKVEQCNKDSLLAVFLNLPNVFTPNNDQINDTYNLDYRNLKMLNVVIIDRWGTLVKEYDGLIEIWDGTDQNGNLLNEGVYFAKAVAESFFGDVLVKSTPIHIYK